MLYQSQYGFRKQDSTLHAVSQSIFDTIDALEKKKSSLSVF